MSDRMIVERLRYKDAVVESDNTLCDEAADEIERLTAENAALRSRLAEADALLLMTKWSVLCVAEDAYRAHRLDISDSQYALLNRIDAFRAADSASVVQENSR